MSSENKPVKQQAKETYRDNMPESLGGRPPTVAEKTKEKLDSAKQGIDEINEETRRRTKHDIEGDKRDKSLSKKGEEIYRDNAPESMGGRPPTVTEKGKEKLDSAKQGVEDETRSAKHELGGGKSLTQKGKETYRDNMPESMGGRPPTVTEKGKEKLDSTKQSVKDEARSAKHELVGDKPLSQKGKETYRDNMPESMGGRPPTVTEKGKEKLDSAKQRIDDEARSAKHGAKPLKEQGKELYKDNAPESLGGRPPTVAEQGKEKLDSATERMQDETRSIQQESGAGGKSLLQMGKELLKDTMPQALGGRPPTVSEELKDTVSGAGQQTKETVDVATRRPEDSLSGRMEDLSVDNRPQEDVSIKGKSLTEQAKALFRENMPEALGGRSPTLAEQGTQRIGDETRSVKEVGQEVGEQGKAKVDNVTK